MVLILDGGSTTVFEELTPSQQSDLRQSPLWTSAALSVKPSAVLQAHTSYVLAGADLLSSMTYQLCPLTLVRDAAGKPADLYAKGMELVLQACRDTKTSPVLTLGSYAAMFGDGGEYSRSYASSDWHTLYDFHTNRLLHFSANVAWTQIAFVAFETLPHILEAHVLLKLIQDNTIPGLQSKKIWISFSCANTERVPSLLKDIQGLLTHEGTRFLWGLGINCFKNDVATILLPKFCSILQSSALVSVIYPDNGQMWDAQERRFVGEQASATAWAQNLFDMIGATTFPSKRLVLGGCCCTTPEHIHALRRLFDHDGERQS